MSRLFDDRLFRAGESLGWTPADPKDVGVRFENGVLTLRGERKLEQEDERENYHRIERSYGTFTRSF